MDAAQTTITTVDAAVGFGLLFFYSSAADVAATAAALVLAIADVDAATVVAVATTMAIAVNGLLFFLFSSAVETVVLAANFFTGVATAAPSYIQIHVYIFKYNHKLNYKTSRSRIWKSVQKLRKI